MTFCSNETSLVFSGVRSSDRDVHHPEANSYNHMDAAIRGELKDDACKKACDDLLKGSDVSQRVIYPDEDQFKAAVVVHLALEPEDFGKFNDYWKKGEWAKRCTGI
ncbi:unnamed protein product, partial [Closterium sp. NIES-65]